MNALWGLGHMMMLTRCLIVVDADVDPHDVRSVAWNALNNVDASRDLVVMPGPVDDLDHSGSFLVSLGHKLGIDATRKNASEGYDRNWPPDLASDAGTKARVTARWREYGLAGIERRSKPDPWSGQGPAAFARLLATLGIDPAAIDRANLTANDVPHEAIGGRPLRALALSEQEVGSAGESNP
jgi:hypothetical protein